MADKEFIDMLNHEALTHSNPNDTTWVPARDALHQLYEAREQNTNDYWLTPDGSSERLMWEFYNLPYITALNLWERTWKLVIGNRKRQTYITYAVAADTIMLTDMEKAA
jgi:hypothetical protein